LEKDFEQTIAAARSGDQDALNELFRSFYTRVSTMVHQSLAADFRQQRPWLGAMLSTGDVVQEVFASVIKDISDFEGTTEGQFVKYLATVTRNRLIDAVRFHEAVRRDRRRVTGGDTVLGKQSVDVGDQAAARDELTRYTRALSSFRDRERALLRSRLEGGEQPPTFEELAEQLGYSSAGAARQAFFTCKARLLIKLGKPKDKDAQR